jgi:hypothetical protein
MRNWCCPMSQRIFQLKIRRLAKDMDGPALCDGSVGASREDSANLSLEVPYNSIVDRQHLVSEAIEQVWHCHLHAPLSREVFDGAR